MSFAFVDVQCVAIVFIVFVASRQCNTSSTVFSPAIYAFHDSGVYSIVATCLTVTENKMIIY